MWRQSLINISQNEFKDLINSKQIFILYPQSPYTTLFLSYLMQNVSGELLYYRLKATDNTISQMLAGLIDEINITERTFAQSTKKILDTKDITALAQTFAKDLSNFNNDTILYLDELDRLTLSDEYNTFFTTLIQNLENNNKLIVNSRELTTSPWKQFVIDDKATVLGTERRGSNLMFALDESDKPQLEIYAFGRGRAIINGLPVEAWDGALPRHLFFYFIDKELITRNEIFELFWSSLNVKEATNVFHVTKRKISERLSMNVLDLDNYELTMYSEGFYRPADKIVRHYDVAEFESAVDEASMTFDDDEQAQLYKRALNLYQAPFLTDIDMPWVHARREKLQRQLLEALIGVARIHKSNNQAEEALGYFMRAIHEKPLREDIHREVIALYLTLGYPDEALKQYQQLETMLGDILNVAPGPETQALREKI